MPARESAIPSLDGSAVASTGERVGGCNVAVFPVHTRTRAEASRQSILTSVLVVIASMFRNSVQLSAPTSPIHPDSQFSGGDGAISWSSNPRAFPFVPATESGVGGSGALTPPSRRWRFNSAFSLFTFWRSRFLISRANLLLELLCFDIWLRSLI